MSLRKIANVVETSRATIARLAEEEGIALQTSEKLTPAQRKEAFQLLDTGLSLRQVAKRFEVSPESLRRLVKRHTQ